MTGHTNTCNLCKEEYPDSVKHLCPIPHIEGCRCSECYVWCDDKIVIFGKVYVCQNANEHKDKHFAEGNAIIIYWNEKGIEASMLEAAKLIDIDDFPESQIKSILSLCFNSYADHIGSTGNYSHDIDEARALKEIHAVWKG